MCGIVGVFNRQDRKPVDRQLIKKMTDVIAHRGPDGEGFYFDDKNGIGFGHRRLAIIDLKTGNQPMTNKNRRLWITFNGEIYNYKEIKQELQAKGYIFRTDSDTEVILHSYEEYGEECPNHFNGIFAFAIWDIRKQSLFLARDHFGVKPLYYCQNNGSFYFASELKAILADSSVPREVDLNALNLCLTFRYTPSPWTLFKGINKLKPGCSLSVTHQEIKECRYWQDSGTIDRKIKEDEWVWKLREAMEKAVKRQMISDVPIGLSLSSGVDSNTVLSLMSQHSNCPVNSFTVGFAGREDTSEIEPAREMAARFGADFYEQIITEEDYIDFMNRYIWHLEEPIGNDSAAAYYFVAEMARQQGIKVLLNGQGADEAFAGYKRYFGIKYKDWLKFVVVPPFSWILPKIIKGSVLGERYQRFLYSLCADNEEELFIRTYSIITDEAKRKLIKRDVLEQMDSCFLRNFVNGQLAKAPRGNALERMTYVDARTSLPDNLLLCEDKMAMAASVEARVPFLDIELMALAESIPGKYKLKGKRDKHIHRKACQKWVGNKVASRPQIGFDSAVNIWLKAQLVDYMQQIIKIPGSFSNTFLYPEYISTLLEEHSEGRRDHQRILFLLLSLESWYEVFFSNWKSA